MYDLGPDDTPDVFDSEVAHRPVIEFDLHEPYIKGAAMPPQRLPKAELINARAALVESWRAFVARCCREKLTTFAEAQKVCLGAGVTLERADIDGHAP